jgi:hypothetical protein
MKERMCNLFEPCDTPEAPLCPIQVNTIKHGVWYPGEPVCKSKRFLHLSWIQKQLKIAHLKLTADDGFFTVRMLEEIHTITKSTRGADPDEPDAELKWFAMRAEKRMVQRKKRKIPGSKDITGKEPVRKDMLL